MQTSLQQALREGDEKVTYLKAVYRQCCREPDFMQVLTLAKAIC